MNVSAAANESPGIGLPLRNFGLSLTSKIVSLGAHLAFVMLTARLFSKEEVAVIAVIGIVTMVMDVCKGMGLGTLLLKRLPQMGESEAEEARVMTVTYLYYSFLPPLLLVTAGLAYPIVSGWLGFSHLHHSNILRLGLAMSFFTVLSNTNILALQAMQQFGNLAILTLLTAALQRLLPCLAAAWFGWDLERFMTWSAAAAALGFAVSCIPLVPLLSSGGFGMLRWEEFWPNSRHFFATSLLRYGATQIDQLLVAVMFPPATLAVYFMLRRLYSLGVVLVGSMIDALVPELAQQAGSDPVAARARLAKWSRLFSFAGSTGAALMAGNGSAIIEMLLGPGYGDDTLLIALFAASTSLYFLYCFSQVDLVLFQAPERILWMAAATAAANLTAGPIISRWLGVHSVPLAMLVGYLLGLVVAGWQGGTGPAHRRLWRIREVGDGLAVVALASLTPILARHVLLHEWERFVAINLTICIIVGVHFCRKQLGFSLLRLGHRTA